VKRAQQAGFSLAEIAVLLRLDRVRDRHAAQRLAARKVAEIDQQIDALQKLRHALSALTVACERGAGDIPCPILEASRTSPEAERLVTSARHPNGASPPRSENSRQRK
jgi:MerR family transcriptional regulator, mercuric resistance operon regulatory protein